MNIPFLRKGRGHLLSNKQQEGACSRSIMAARIFSLFCLLAILQRSSSSLCSLQYRGQPPHARGARCLCARAPGLTATALDGPGWSGGRPSLRPSQACKARAARAYQQYIPRLGACHGTKAGSRGLGHAGLNGLCGLQCLCAAAAAADHTLHSCGIIVQLVRPSFWNPGI